MTSRDLERSDLQQQPSPTDEATLFTGDPANELTVYRPQGVHLGRIPSRDGWSAGFRDTHKQPVYEAGFSFIVGQSSVGATYIDAQALPGNTIAVLNTDASSRESMWLEPRDDGNARVDMDHGKPLPRGRSLDWLGLNLGTPGVRGGVIRVTDELNDARYYVLRADFAGEPDDWFVQGSVQEVWLNQQFKIDQGRRELTGTTVGQLALLPETVHKTALNNRHMLSLRTAFDHTTNGYKVLSNNPDQMQAIGVFAHVALGILQEISKTDPQILTGKERDIDELGRLTRLIIDHHGPKGYLTSLDSDDANRINYLQALRQTIDDFMPTEDNCYYYTCFTQKALGILGDAIGPTTTVMIDQSSPALVKSLELIDADERETAEAVSYRAATLRGTIFDGEGNKPRLNHATAIPGQKVEFELGSASPILTEHQTYEAFSEKDKTDARCPQYSHFYEPVVAIITIKGKRFALTDAGKSDRFGKINSDQRQLALMEIVDDNDQSREGLTVSRRVLEFGDEDYNAAYVIYDPSSDGNATYAKDVNPNVTIAYDANLGKVTIHSTYQPVTVSTKDSVKTLAWDEVDRLDLDTRRKVMVWQHKVASVRRDTDMLRERLMGNLGTLTDEQREKRLAQIESIIAKGPERFWTYNGHSGDKWHRSQPYYVTVDAAGNIWGEFKSRRYEVGITGRPLSAGKHLIHKNPLSRTSQ